MVKAEESTSSSQVDSSPTTSPSEQPLPSASLTPSPFLEPTPTSIPEVITTQTPTPTVSPNPPPDEEQGTLAAVVVPNTSAESLDNLNLEPTDINSASLTTDKADYAPTDSAIISGTGFKANTTYIIVVSSTDPPAVTETKNVTTDPQGQFVYTYQLDGTYRPNYSVVLKDQAGNTVATTSFTDTALSLNLDQCHNDTLASLSTLCGNSPTSWANGDVNGNNSQYREGDGLPYRFAIEKLGDGVWFVRVQYDFTKGGKFAIDRLTRYDLTQVSDPCQGITGCITGSPVVGTILIPGEVASPSSTQPGLPNSGGLDIAGTASPLVTGDKVLTVWKYSTGIVTLGSADPNVTQSGDASGDSTREFKFQITTSGCPTQGCKLMLGWTGHIASSETNGNGGWDAGNGASFITGAPFHMRVLGVDTTNGTSGGNQDRSVQLSAIVSPSTVTIHKVVSPNDAGPSFGYTTTGSLSPTTFSLHDGGTQTFSPAPGSYTVVEDNPLPTYALTDLTCTASGTGSSAASSGSTANITIGSGGGATIDCIYTNTLQQGNLVIVKNTVGGDTTFNYSVTGPTPLSPSITTSGGTGSSGPTPVNSGTNYAITETVPSGWDFNSASCDKAFTAGANGVTGVTVVAGQTTTCTFSNTKQGSITIVKNTVGGNDTFNYTSNFGVTSLTTSDGTVSQTVNNLVPGSGYSISETVLSGWDLTSATCDHGTIGAITVLAGQTTTCTFTNTKHGHIIVDKVTNPSGNSQSFDFDASGTGYNDFSLTDVATPNDQELSVGSYSVSETVPSGWDKTSATCDQGQTPGSINLVAGQTVTCTFTNTKKGHLIVQKTTLPGGDTTSFTINATSSTGGIVTSGGAGTVTDATDKDYEVTPGTYSVAETVPAGWDKTGDTCQSVSVGAGETKTCLLTNTKHGKITIVKEAVPNSDQDFSFTDNFGNGNDVTFLLDDDTNGTLPKTRDFEVVPGSNFNVSETVPEEWKQFSATCTGEGNTPASITVAPGGSVTCTFVNHKLGSITIVKNTVGGNGDFGFKMTGETLSSSTTVTTSGNTGSQTFNNIDPDNTYSILENVPDGWDFTSVACFNVTVGGSSTSRDPASFTITNGGHVTCTFTNTKKPKLTVTKIVVNDNGGTKGVSDFPLFVDQGSVTSGIQNPSTIGTHVVSETGNADYDEVISGQCDAQGNVTLAAGDEKSCTITNNDKAPSLRLVKHVTNNDGGVAVAGDWSLDAGGSTPISGAGGASSDPSFDAGTYTLSETGPAGYSASPWSCTGGSQNGDQITVGLGESATCEITNDDIAPTLKLVKHVIKDNGGTAVAGDWNLTATGTGGFSDSGDSATFHAVKAGVEYTLSESTVAGYSEGAWSCSGGQLANGKVTLALAENITCEITNNDIQPKLTVIKHVINDNGGNALASAFSMFVIGSSASPDTFGGDEGGTTVALNAGSYTVGEVGVLGYSSSFNGDCVGSISVGETKTCTITNDDQPGTITIIKDAQPNDLQDFSFTGGLGSFLLDDDAGVDGIGLNGDTDRPQSKVSDPLNAGSYTVDETLPNPFWTLQGVNCTGGNFTPTTTGVTVNLGLGENVTCTFVNHKESPTRTLGFWQTHTEYTSTVFATAPLSGNMGIGSTVPHKGSITNVQESGKSQLFGAFYSSISKQSNNKPRKPIDQARMTLLQQLVAAKLNCAKFGCATSVQTLINNADSVYATGTAAQILVSASALDAYNNSGDTIIIGNAGSATPKNSQGLANKGFWDSP